MPNSCAQTRDQKSVLKHPSFSTPGVILVEASFCVCVWVCSVVSDSATTRTVTHQAPLSMGFLSQEYWSELPFPSQSKGLPNPGIEPMSLPSLHWQVNSLPLHHLESLITSCQDYCFNYLIGAPVFSGWYFWKVIAQNRKIIFSSCHMSHWHHTNNTKNKILTCPWTQIQTRMKLRFSLSNSSVSGTAPVQNLCLLTEIQIWFKASNTKEYIYIFSSMVLCSCSYKTLQPYIWNLERW